MLTTSLMKKRIGRSCGIAHWDMAAIFLVGNADEYYDTLLFIFIEIRAFLTKKQS